MRQIIREILLEFHKEDLPVVFRRKIEIPNLPKDIRKAVVFLGMRRVGKTYLMYQHMIDLLSEGREKEKILYINFEDDRLVQFGAKDLQLVLDIYYELYPTNVKSEDLVFYFDEIQNVNGWEKFIRRLIDKEKMSIYITGSSAKSLSREIATSLRGRCLEREVFPFSFVEYLQYHGIENLHRLTKKEISIIKHHCRAYLKYGGFPETLPLSANLHHQVIQSYVNAAVFRDVIDRHQLKNPHIIKLFLVHCLQNIAAPLSVTKVYKTFKSRGETLGRNSLYEYLEYFEDAYLICSVPIFDLSTRKRMVNPKKIYCVDSGVIHGYSIKPEKEYSSCLENAVFIHLRSQYSNNIYYYKTRSGKEVDFIVQKLNGEVELYQVCVEFNHKKTKKRELDAISEAATELNLNHAYIITNDAEETVETNGVTIHIIPYWQWALHKP